MPLRSDWSEELCPIRRSLDVLGDPWVLLIVRDALHGRGRYDQLRAHLGVSDAVLSRRLRAMVEAGLLERVPYRDGGRERHAYATTPAAADLLPVLQSLVVWAERHTPTPPGGAHMALVHETCGAETVDGATCSACGEPLRPQDVAWDKPWRGRRDRLRAPGELAGSPPA